MKKIKELILNNWYKILVLLFLVAVFAFYMVIGENSYIAIQDNLDLFIPQFQMMKDEGTFFTFNATTSFLHGITRDGLPSEWSLYTILYVVFPSFVAYILGYLIKIVIGLASSILLAKDILQNEGLSNGRYSQKNDKAVDILIWLCGFAYGILNLFPAFGIPFASIPLIIYIFRNIYRNPSGKWYFAAFLYPFISYFSYFGLFILAYICVAIIWLWIRDAVLRKDVKGPRLFKLHISVSLIIGLILLAIGSVLFEYRLFSMMLFSDTVSIRSTMVESSLTSKEIVDMIIDVLINGMMHIDDAHSLIVLPVCVIYFVFLNISYMFKKNIRGIFHDYYNLCVITLIFNSVIYGIYYSEIFRNIVFTLVPPLEGWQFNRTVFFNPFLWYACLFIICYRLLQYVYASCERKKIYGNVNTFNSNKYFIISAWVLAFALPVLSVAAIVMENNRYNDLRNTAYGIYYQFRHNGETTDNLSYGEFYSTDLFEEIKEDIGYDGEWSLAYGMYPAVLEYNGIATLDGYLGFYSQEYKERFRKIIAPALDRSLYSKIYFDNWGARCYLAYGTDQTPNMGTKSLVGLVENDIYIDAEAIKALDGKYIFSRIDISNAEKMGIELIGSYGDEGDAYKVYVYVVK